MKIKINNYNPQWENDFLQEKNHLSQTLSDFKTDIQHIGSTSIKGLGAKPIIDILIGLETESQLDLLADKMINVGFTYYRIYNDVMPERRFFVRLFHNQDDNPPQYFDKDELTPSDRGFISKVNCHCVVKNSEFWNRHIFFRDYLKNNYKARDEYNNLKIKLSKKDWVSGNDYTDAKTEFIKNIEYKNV